jgi:myo-inositol-1(or 4)-monophosphatase
LPATEFYAAENDDLRLLLDAAAEAGRIAMRYFGQTQEVWMKAGQSPVGEADYATDKYLRETLMGARPDYGWLSEETTDTSERLTARRTFVVDPIDGTRGFIAGKDMWCVSVAIVEDGRTLAGVLECPARGETFWALPGKGAWKNDMQIRVREAVTPYEIGGPKAMIDMLPDDLRAILLDVAYIPSLAYRLALIAEGSLDGSFVKPSAHDWDIAAADLILREAGGDLLDAQGEKPRFGDAEIRHGALVAGSGFLLPVMARTIATQAA